MKKEFLILILLILSFSSCIKSTEHSGVSFSKETISEHEEILNKKLWGKIKVVGEELYGEHINVSLEMNYVDDSICANASSILDSIFMCHDYTVYCKTCDSCVGNKTIDITTNFPLNCSEIVIGTLHEATYKKIRSEIESITPEQ